MTTRIILTATFIAIGAATAFAAASRVETTITSDERCIQSNGLPDHKTGTFPNPHNPNAIRAQNTNVCLPLEPTKGQTATPVRTTGVALNGILIRPGTADYYDPSSPRGFSQRPVSDWRVEAMFAADDLGIDMNNAHVDQRGLYHYHGVPPSLVGLNNSTQIGWAADGFEIHYSGDQARSSYMLKPGTRPTGPADPGGAYDGTYVQDWEYMRGLGNLDACNGGVMNGEYVYFVTDTYPFYPRCLYGTDITTIR